MSMGRLMNYCSPDIQKSYHADLMPLFLRRMTEEEKIKMKAQVVSCTVSFVTSLTGPAAGSNEDDIDEAELEAG